MRSTANMQQICNAVTVLTFTCCLGIPKNTNKASVLALTIFFFCYIVLSKVLRVSILELWCWSILFVFHLLLFFCILKGLALLRSLIFFFVLFSRADVLYWLQADVHIYVYKIYILKESYVYVTIKPNKNRKKKNVIYILVMHARGWEVISRITNGSAFFCIQTFTPNVNDFIWL